MTRLDRARERLAAGDGKRALGELWYAEAEHRADPAELQEALSLAEGVAALGKGRVQGEAELLISVLNTDLERAPRSPAPPPRASPEPSRPRLGMIAAGTLGLSVALFVASVAVLGDDFLLNTDPTRSQISDVLFILGAIAGVVAVCMFILWIAVALQDRRRG